MLEEHCHNVERNMPNPDWPAPVPSMAGGPFAGLRQRISDVLRVLADRLEPARDRSRRDEGAPGTWASESMR
jgi:hypothetical protein